MFEVASGGSTRNTQSTPVGASAATTPNATTTTLPVVPLGCANPKYVKELSATKVIVFLRAMHLPLVVAVPALSSTTEAPGGADPAGGASSKVAAVVANRPGACSTAGFVDQRGHGVSYVTVYPTSAAAARAVASQSHSTSPVVSGTVVLDLDPSLAAFRSAYVADSARLVPTAGLGSSR
jgi:hypothetical protein